MPKKSETDICQARHARVTRVRAACYRIWKFTGAYVPGELDPVQMNEAAFIQKRSQEIEHHLGDEMSRSDLEQAERDTSALCGRFCVLFRDAIDSLVKHQEPRRG